MTSQLQLRILSAAIAIGILIGAVFLGPWALLAVISVVIFACQVEFIQLTPVKKHRLLTRLALAIYFAAFLTFGLAPEAVALSLLPLYWLLLILATMNRRWKLEIEDIFRLQTVLSLGFVYIVVCPAFALKLLQVESGQWWFVSLLVTVLCGDTFAYFVGRKLGKKKVYPLLSPNKTVAGTWGGLLGSSLGLAICWSVFFIHDIFWPFLGLAVLTGLMAQVGDFFESLLKRIAGVKDSGQLMPGHGGLLDRIDGILFAAPVFFTLQQILGQFLR